MYFNARYFKARHLTSAYFIKPETASPVGVVDTFRYFKASFFGAKIFSPLTVAVDMSATNITAGSGSISVTGRASSFLYRPVEVLGDGTHAVTSTNTTDTKTSTPETVAGMDVAETIIQPDPGQAVSWE